MIEQTLRRFCESPHRGLIVIAGTFIVGLVLVLPLVDVYRAGHNDKTALLAELDSARSVAAELETPRSASRKSLPNWKSWKRGPSTKIRWRRCAENWSTWPRRRVAAFAG